MIYNYDQFIKHNQKFYNSFVDLKVVGWKTYSSALNDYTQGFFKTQLEASDEQVEKLGDTMKSIMNPTMKGICK